MADQGNNGPDGSSLKSVSSLRSQFENMNKTNAAGKEATSSTPSLQSPAPQLLPPVTSTSISSNHLLLSAAQHALPQPVVPPRPVSPYVRPDGAAKEAAVGPSSIPPPVPKERPSIATIQAISNRDPARAAPSPLSPRPIKPPSFIIQPPQSPPRVSTTALVSEPPLLNPDAAVNMSPTATVPPRTSSRPHTPSLDRRRSPGAAGSNPPSPPPPRRSTELRRERDAVRTASTPAVNRLDKPSIPTRPASFASETTTAEPGAIADELSPFNSPPSSSSNSSNSSGSSPEMNDTVTPPLPGRPRVDAPAPRPPPDSTRPPLDVPVRSRTLDVGFESPSVRRTVAIKRRELSQDFDTPARGIAAPPPQVPEERPAVSLSRSYTVAEPPPRPPSFSKPPPPPSAPASTRPPLHPPPPSAPAATTTKPPLHPPSAPASASAATMKPPPPPPPPLPPLPSAPVPVKPPPSSAPPVARPPPPRPPRHPLITSGPGMDPSPSSTLSSSPPKRVVSTPTAHQPPPPPSRSLTRSNTILERASDRTTAAAAAAAVDARPNASPISGSNPFSAARPESFPDPSNVNRRPPFVKHGTHEIFMKSDARILAVCGRYVCTSGHFTRAWDAVDGELVMSLSHGDTIKGTAVAFKPAVDPKDEGARLWIGNSHGELMEADILTSTVIAAKPNVHGRSEVVKIYRHYNDLWTLDEGGGLHVWGPDAAAGVPSLNSEPHHTFRVPRNHNFSMVVGDELWHAAGKEIRVFCPSYDGKKPFQATTRPMAQDSAGEVTAGTLLKSDPGRVFFGHVDGKVSMYSRSEFACLGLVTVSNQKITSLTGVGRQLWAAFNSGRVSVFDVDSSPWAVRKEWQAHDHSVVKLIADPAGFYKLDRSQVVSLGTDNRIRVWDGLLQDDWLENQMRLIEPAFCRFEQVSILIMTWNAGASTPHSLRYDQTDDAFIRNLIRTSGCPDILVFGFQELVDLEDKTATAKRLFKSKKKDAATDQERMSHQYRNWRDFLMQSIDDYMPPGQLYHLLHTSTLVGLFTCIFVKASVRDRIRNLSSGDVKRGMGGLHGNKGAIAVRFVLEDTSMCFVNCHLAAGQSHANARNADILHILEASVFPTERDASTRLDNYVGGGDGSQILDHELCMLNGDLNYRIDTMSRDTVVGAVKAGNLTKLLDRDQLLVARRRFPGFRLRTFEELPITFAPTYKYDVGTDNYDSSEKRRSPAWCDRLLFRGGGRITQLDYRRHEVRVSDHRPVTGSFRATVKRIDPKQRTVAWMESQREFEDWRAREARDEKLFYLTSVCGFDEATSAMLIQGGSQRAHR